MSLTQKKNVSSQNSTTKSRYKYYNTNVINPSTEEKPVGYSICLLAVLCFIIYTQQTSAEKSRPNILGEYTITRVIWLMLTAHGTVYAA